jgi:hypothetical protein
MTVEEMDAKFLKDEFNDLFYERLKDSGNYSPDLGLNVKFLCEVLFLEGVEVGAKLERER